MVLKKLSSGIKKHSSVNSPRLDFITGLKGYAALGVFLIHVGSVFRSIHPMVSGLIDYGKFGIVAFFFLSSVTISKSLFFKKNVSYVSYLFRRGLRIIPLYYLVLFLAIGLTGIHTTIKDILFHIFFINLSPFGYAYQGSILGVEWTVPIQMWFYMLLPFFVLFARKFRWLGVFSLVAAGIFFYFHTALSLYPQPNGFDWSLQKHLITYALGIFCAVASFTYSTRRHLIFYLLPTAIFVYVMKNVNLADSMYFLILFLLYMITISIRIREADAIVVISQHVRLLKLTNQLALLMLLVNYAIEIRANSYIFTAFWLCTFYLSLEGYSSRIRKMIFENRFIVYIGSISYAIYLSHDVIYSFIDSRLYLNNALLKFGITVLCTLLASILLTSADKQMVRFLKNKVFFRS